MAATDIGTVFVPNARAAPLPQVISVGSQEGIYYWTTANTANLVYRDAADWTASGAGGSGAYAGAFSVDVYGAPKTFRDSLGDGRWIVDPVVLANTSLAIRVLAVDGTTDRTAQLQTYANVVSNTSHVSRLSATPYGVTLVQSPPASTQTVTTYTYSGSAYDTLDGVSTTAVPNASTLGYAVPEGGYVTVRANYVYTVANVGGSLVSRHFTQAVAPNSLSIVFTDIVNQTSANVNNALSVQWVRPYRETAPGGPNVFSLYYTTANTYAAYLTNTANATFVDTSVNLTAITAGRTSTAGTNLVDLSASVASFSMPATRVTATVANFTVPSQTSGALSERGTLTVTSAGVGALCWGTSEGTFQAQGINASTGSSGNPETLANVSFEPVGTVSILGGALGPNFAFVGDVEGNGARALGKQTVTTAPPTIALSKTIVFFAPMDSSGLDEQNNVTPVVTNPGAIDFSGGFLRASSGSVKSLAYTNSFTNYGVQDQFSVSFWIRSVGGQWNQSDATIIGRGGFNTTPRRCWGVQALSFFRLRMRMLNLDAAGTPTAVLEINNGIADNQWHHVVFTYAGSASEVGADVTEAYVDGSAGSVSLRFTNAAFTPAADITTPGKDLYALTEEDQNSANQSFFGDLGKMYIFDGVLTAQDIANLYADGAPT